jgi:hypothetical protein
MPQPDATASIAAAQPAKRLIGGGNRIQTIGPAPAKGSSGRCQSETAARKAEPLTGSGPKRQCLPGVAAHSLSLRGGTASSNPTSSSGRSVSAHRPPRSKKATISLWPFLDAALEDRSYRGDNADAPLPEINTNALRSLTILYTYGTGASTLRQALADPGSGGIDFGPPADWLGFLDFHSKRRYAPLDLRNTGSSGSDGPHLPAGRMSRGPHSYRHQWRLTTLSISHCCTLAMADTRSAAGQVRYYGEGLNATMVKLESVDDGTYHAARHRHTARAR